MILKNFVLFLTVLVFVGCGEVTTGSEVPQTTSSPSTSESIETIPENSTGTTQTQNETVSLSGKVTYDFVPFKSGNVSGLDYNNIVQKPIRGAVVEIVNASGTVLSSTNTDENGNYAVSITASNVKVRVLAKLYKAPSTGQSSWDFQVKDNTNSNALYVMEGSLAGVGTSGTQTRNLHAASGWGGSSYTSTRVAAPFAILDVVYSAIEKIRLAEPQTVFPSLDIFWSTNNLPTPTISDVSIGHIGTSHYNLDSNALYLLGKENSDTDEYDQGIVAHEWTHYYENKFSRTDSTGGQHVTGDMLDIRLAFGEGFATAFAGMIIDSPLYFDSDDESQGDSFGQDLEEGGSVRNAGWYSEASIFHLLYDLYDSNDDVGDRVSLGFKPIHDALINGQKNTEAFTSIFTFITALKAANPNESDAIDAITSNENIAPIQDIYGTGRTNRAIENANPLYATLNVGETIKIYPNYTATGHRYTYNKLGVYNFVTFTIPTDGQYMISANSTSNATLDFYAFKGASKEIVLTSNTTGSSISGIANLKAGVYRMFIFDSRKLANITINVTLNEI